MVLNFKWTIQGCGEFELERCRSFAVNCRVMTENDDTDNDSLMKAGQQEEEEEEEENEEWFVLLRSVEEPMG